jgi:hypothetical protein
VEVDEVHDGARNARAPDDAIGEVSQCSAEDQPETERARPRGKLDRSRDDGGAHHQRGGEEEPGLTAEQAEGSSGVRHVSQLHDATDDLDRGSPGQVLLGQVFGEPVQQVRADSS